MNPLVYIIILNWNGKDLTLDCLKSLEKIDYDNYRILIVDNGSKDDSVRVIMEEYPDVEILPLESNIGYAAGNNAGFEKIKKKDPKYIIFLNNDTLVDKHFIEPLVLQLQENSQIGQTVPKIYYAANIDRIWYAGGKVNLWFGLVKHIGIRSIDKPKFMIKKFTDYATGCCFCMRKEDFEKLNGFDTIYPMYGEDVDLSLRVRASGKKILFEPNSIIWHKVSASIGGELSFNKMLKKIKGLIILFSKYSSLSQKIIGYIFLILIYLPSKVISRLIHNILFKGDNS
ncbi:MAG: glycosyltransferase family 2 protein [Candidatus Neomarinimicrobiota bacterium]